MRNESVFFPKIPIIYDVYTDKMVISEKLSPAKIILNVISSGKIITHVEMSNTSG